MKKKGQAAMEFLMTYGWAILAAIIVIGVLAVYFRPGTLTTSSTIVTAPFYANAWNIQGGAPGTMNLELQNNAGEDVVVNVITVTGTGSSAGDDCTISPAATLAAGALQNYALVGASCTIASGDAYTGDIVIEYTRGGGSTALTSTGTITDTAV